MAYKKGVVLTYEMIIILITLLLGTVLIYYFIGGPLKEGVESTFDKFTCKESVSLKAQAKSLELQENVPLKCSSQKLTFDSVEDINEEIANSMFDCWDQFYQGKSDFLTNYELADKYPTFCFKCASITFDPSIKGNNLNLGDYIKNKDNLVPEKQDISYLKFFTGYSEENKNNTEFIKGLNNLNTNEELYIFFMAQKFITTESIFSYKTATAAIGGCWAGLKLGGAFGIALNLNPYKALASCGGGAVTSGTVFALSNKESYTPLMFIKPAKEAVQICNERTWFKPNEK